MCLTFLVPGGHLRQYAVQSERIGRLYSGRVHVQGHIAGLCRQCRARRLSGRHPAQLYLLNGPDATNEVMCGIGQSLVYGEYLKIVCQRGPRERVLEEASARP